MPANRCPNPSCEYFNRALPNNAKVCPWCSTPVGNVVSATPQPSSQSQTNSQPQTNPQPQPIQQPPRPVVDQPSYHPPQPPVDYSTVYQERAIQPPTPPVYNPPPPRLPVLKLIHTTGREFRLPGEGGFIGRRSQSSTIAPEIDLTGIPNEGIVSRRHARVDWDWTQNSYIIVDMSTNGIFLNGNLLTPGVQYRLLNGDVLRFGQDNLVNFTAYIM